MKFNTVKDENINIHNSTNKQKNMHILQYLNLRFCTLLSQDKVERSILRVFDGDDGDDFDFAGASPVKCPSK